MSQSQPHHQPADALHLLGSAEPNIISNNLLQLQTYLSPPYVMCVVCLCRQCPVYPTPPNPLLHPTPLRPIQSTMFAVCLQALPSQATIVSPAALLRHVSSTRAIQQEEAAGEEPWNQDLLQALLAAIYKVLLNALSWCDVVWWGGGCVVWCGVVWCGAVW